MQCLKGGIDHICPLFYRGTEGLYMSISVHRKNLDASYWSVSGSNVVSPVLCSYLSAFFTVDPSLVNTLSGTKASTFTPSQLLTNFLYTTSDAVTATAAHYADSNWSSLGWTPGDDDTFFAELQTFAQNNYGQQLLNPGLSDVVLLIARGLIGGTAYSVPFMFFGNIGGGPPAPDAFTSLLLHFNSIGGGDSSSDNHTIAFVHGATVSPVVSPGVFGQAELLAGSYPAISYSSAIDVGTASDFTIEFWFNLPSVSGAQTLCAYSADYHFGVLANGANLGYYAGSNGTSSPGFDVLTGATGSTTITANTWHHVAVVRQGTTYNMYVDGALDFTHTNATAIVTRADSFRFGQWGSGGINANNGTMFDEFRFSNIARYTSGFTVPSSPFVSDSNTKALFHFDTFDNGDQSGNAHTISSLNLTYYVPPADQQAKFGAASYFGTPGSNEGSGGQYVSASWDSSFDVGAGDFTIDFWFNRHGTVPYAQVFFNLPGAIMLYPSDSTNTMGYNVSSNGTTNDIMQSFPTAQAVGTITMPDNVWTHFAFVRHGNVWTGYVNGVQDMQITASGTVFAANSALTIGGGVPSLSGTGFIDEFRFSKGIARWTAPFTPPAMSYDNVSPTTDHNTLMLLHFDGSLADSSVYGNIFSGGTPAYTSGKFGNALDIHNSTGSISCSSGTAQFNFGSINFTMEFWLKCNAAPTANAQIFGNDGQFPSPNTDWDFFFQSSGNLVFFTPIASISYAYPHLTDGVFHHIAAVRNGTTLTLYVDGVSVGTHSMSGSMPYTPASTPYITVGADWDNTTPLNGAIDEVRISNVARWTSNFTPPASSY